MNNTHCVGRQGDGVVILLAPSLGRLTEQEALELAAWLVILALKTPKDFERVYDEATK